MTNSEYNSIDTLLKVIGAIETNFENMSHFFVKVDNNLHNVQSDLNHLPTSKLDKIKDTIILKNDSFEHKLDIISIKLDMIKNETGNVFNSFYDDKIIRKWDWSGIRMPDNPPKETEIWDWSGIRMPDAPLLNKPIKSEYKSIDTLLNLVGGIESDLDNMSHFYVRVDNHLHKDQYEYDLNHLSISELEKIKDSIIFKNDNFTCRLGIIARELKVIKEEMNMVYDSLNDKVFKKD